MAELSQEMKQCLQMIFKHLDNPIYQPFDAIFLSVNSPPPPTPYEFHWLLFPLSFHSLFNFVSSDVEWEWLIILNYSYLQNVVFDSNYWPYSQILISCLPTNCGMSLDTYISGSKLFVRYYIRGECREGDNCRFSHDSKDVPVSIT